MVDSSMRVILVEDDDIDAEALRRVFAEQCNNCSLIWAHDGQEAYDLLCSNAGPDKPYIVLLDLNMPRMNGHEFLAAIRENKKVSNTVVFVFTTSGEEQDVERAYANNVAGYVVKTGGRRSYETTVHMLKEYWENVVLPV